jgi:DNA-directed RNA polymerase specialized sigma24 family protein
VKGKDWQHFVFNREGRWIERLARLAERRFPDAAASGAAYNFAFDRISENDWRLLESYTGRAQPGTYLTAVFCRLLEDYSRARYGRPRPPAWLQRMGELWLRIYRMLCLERVEPESIVDSIALRAGRPRGDVRQTIATIRARIPDCGQARGEVAMADPADAHEETDAANPESELARQELTELLRTLRSVLSAADAAPVAPRNPSSGGPDPSRVPSPALLRSALQLDDEERLVLRLLYQDGRTVADAARALHLPEHQVRRKRERAVSRLREALRAAGIGPELLVGD